MKPPRETLHPSPKKLAPNCWRGGFWSRSRKAYEPRQRHPQTTNEFSLAGTGPNRREGLTPIGGA
jgi:hypothetical protein